MTRRFDLLIFSLFFILASATWFFLEFKPLLGFILITVIPSIYLGFKKPKPWRRIIFASAILGIGLGSLFDLIQSFNESWVVNIIIPWKIFDILPVDNIFGYFLMTILTLVFYLHFIEANQSSHIPKRFYKLSKNIIGVVSAVFIIFVLKPTLFLIPYPYLFGGIAATMIPIYYTIKHAESLNNMLQMSAYFFFIWFLTEIVALKTNGWEFQGEFIGWVSVFNVSFPFEELFFWMFWYAPFIIASYNFLMKNGSNQEV